MIGCLEGGMKRLQDDIRELFNDEKDLQRISREMQKIVLLFVLVGDEFFWG